MRNLKKFLALVLAMMMVFSMMVTVSAKDISAYGDVDKDEEFYEAIAVLSGMNVLEGDDSGFRPDEYISRAEMAAVLYRIYTGNVGESGKQNAALFADYEDTFTDVKGTGSDWALGYINFDRANGLVKGDPDGMYRPADNVTGYEALAMILRAVGYGKTGEFEGGGYQYQVAYRGSLLGITDNITDGTLGQKATRAMVAEMAFRAVVPGVPQADWAELVGYYTTESVMSDKQRPSLGEEHFGLTHGDLHVNRWGRPSNRWWKAGTSTVYANLMYTPVATFGNIKDECDVIDEFGIKEGKIVTYYVDNVLTSPSDATSAGKEKIREQGVGSTMGGMGTLTEIYKKSNGDYWIVEINTYLALVTDVHEPEPDKHDHIGDRTVDLKLFIDASSGTVDTGVVWKGYETDELSYIEGKYIRVNLDLADSAHAKLATQSNCEVYDLGLAEALVIGDYKENFAAYYPDPARTVVTVSTKDETKADSKKFYLNAHEDGTWVFLNDGYGNILGQTVASFNYGVIGAIVWINNGLNPGHAEAKIYPVNELNTRSDDGYFIKTVTNLNGAAARNAEGNLSSIDSDTDWNGVFDSVANNTKLVGHLVVYSENDDDTIDIITHAYDAAKNNVYFGDRRATRIVDGTPGDIDSPYTVNNGQSNVLNKGKNVMSKANDYTVYLIENDDGGFDRHVGMRNVPTTTGTGVCILEGENGYASLVVLTKTKDDTSRTFVAFVGNAAVATEGSATAKRTNKVQNASDEIYYAHDVYELGTYTGAATKVYDIATNSASPLNATDSNVGNKWNAAIANAGPGLYEFTVDSNNVIESMRQLVALATPTANENLASSDTINNYWYANFATRVKAVGNAMITATYSAIASSEASPVSATQNDIGFNIYDATIIKLTQKKAASEGTVSTSDIFTVGQWNKSDAIPANAAVLVVYERAARAELNNWTAYVYVLAEPEMATVDEIDDTTTPPDCIAVYTRLNDPTKEITSNDRIKIVATGEITVAEGEKAIEAYLKAAGYSIKDMTVTIASNGEHTYTIMSTGGETTYQTTFYWNPEDDVATDGIIVKVGDKSYVVPEDFPYASIGQLLGKTATADLGTYVKVTTTGGTDYFDKDVGASNGDTIEFAYFKVTVEGTMLTGDSVGTAATYASAGTLATDSSVGLYVKKGDKIKVIATITTSSSIVSDSRILFRATEDSTYETTDSNTVVASSSLASDDSVTADWTYTFDGKGDVVIEAVLGTKEDWQ